MQLRGSIRGLMTAVLLSISAVTVQSQISISQSDVENLAGKFQQSYPALDAEGFDLAMSGPNKTWDLSVYRFDVQPDLRLTHLVFPPAGAPDVSNPAFAQANYALKSESQRSVTWQYAKVSPAGVEVLGNIDTATFAVSPGLKIVGAFPVGYGSTWTSNSAVSSPAIPSTFGVSIAANGSIDSWGTMILPSSAGGTISLSVLRLKLIQTTTIKIGIFPVAEFSSTAYQWLTSPATGQFYVAAASTDSVGGLRVLSYYTPFNVDPVSVAARDQERPESPRLLPGYPNPFNPSTTIPFELARSSHVSLTVVNALGQTVAELIDQRLAPGSYTPRFNATGMPSGPYFARLNVDGAVQIQKVLLLK